MAKERLQKILARAGIASRRGAEELIRARRVRVNGKIASIGVSADSHQDRIELDGRRVALEPLTYYLLHKPRGVMTTLHDPEGRPTVIELLRGIGTRVFPVGRLDFHTSGVLLMTNDGELMESLLRPSRKIPKVYVAKLIGHLSEQDLELLRTGVVLDDGYRTRPADVVVLREEPRHSWIQVTVFEGKNRLIYRMAEAIRHPVRRLARIQFAGLSAEGLRPGEYRPLTAAEIEALKKRKKLVH